MKEYARQMEAEMGQVKNLLAGGSGGVFDAAPDIVFKQDDNLDRLNGVGDKTRDQLIKCGHRIVLTKIVHIVQPCLPTAGQMRLKVTRTFLGRPMRRCTCLIVPKKSSHDHDFFVIMGAVDQVVWSSKNMMGDVVLRKKPGTSQAKENVER
jgi:hypothetical protein